MSVYFILNEVTKNVKIGHSVVVKKRLHQLQLQTDCPLRLLATVPGGQEEEREYHEEWMAYYIGHGEWFSISVLQVMGELKITGRELQPVSMLKKLRTAGARGPFRNQLCLRLNDEELALLKRYTRYKQFKSEISALRNMVDGLGGWFTRRDAETKTAEAHSGVSSAPPPVTSVGDARDDERTTSASTSPRSAPSPTQGDEDVDGTSLDDFGGQPRLKLPGLPAGGELS